MQRLAARKTPGLQGKSTGCKPISLTGAATSSDDPPHAKDKAANDERKAQEPEDRDKINLENNLCGKHYFFPFSPTRSSIEALQFKCRLQGKRQVCKVMDAAARNYQPRAPERKLKLPMPQEAN